MSQLITVMLLSVLALATTGCGLFDNMEQHCDLTCQSQPPPPTGPAVVRGETFIAGSGTTVILRTSQLFANDEASSGALFVEDAFQPSHGDVKLQGDLVIFTPTPGFVGDADFRALIADDTGSMPEKVIITFTAR